MPSRRFTSSSRISSDMFPNSRVPVSTSCESHPTYFSTCLTSFRCTVPLVQLQQLLIVRHVPGLSEMYARARDTRLLGARHKSLLYTRKHQQTLVAPKVAGTRWRAQSRPVLPCCSCGHVVLPWEYVTCDESIPFPLLSLLILMCFHHHLTPPHGRQREPRGHARSSPGQNVQGKVLDRSLRRRPRRAPCSTQYRPLYPQQCNRLHCSSLPRRRGRRCCRRHVTRATFPRRTQRPRPKARHC
ncbi:hypothetical protein BCR44DRAFT_1010671 [Catenaria anguillulae PL171]|uniref:Uncharacterized protein n=1 Tax=Catenaria anguillulae PL171 TaxID=765915 RepID=A0A1Y2I431_9FUNG|nr:hypothetical protein BCR44DRAFT_1010671 [Catenaria anguillulae PL171]